jgi:uncharacterized protein (DUF1810 family)
MAQGLDRFVQAQSAVYADALDELRSGRKRSHWMWFVFPQLRGLGRSATSEHYGISDLGEAIEYFRHPVLGPRLVECCRVLAGLDTVSASEVFGSPDDLKLRSCLTLFARAAPTQALFPQLLDKFFGGTPDPATLRLLR